jgi:D-alanine-D-alanine ligase
MLHTLVHPKLLGAAVVDQSIQMSTEEIKALGRVAVLFGGESAEREVSLMSGKGVLEALRSVGVDAHPFDPAERDLQELKAQGFNRVFIALHGRWGEDGCVQGALELLKIPYTGPGVMASAICMDKITTKRLWKDRGLSTPLYDEIEVAKVTAERLQAVAARLGYPLIMKAPHEGSTLGLAKVKDAAGLNEGFAIAAALDQMVLAEQFIDARELTVSIISQNGQPRVLPITEIVAPDGNYDFQNKYYTNTTRYDCPAVLSDTLTQEIQQLALDAFLAVGCTGWARVDVLLRKTDLKPFLLEINTSPGMTSHSLVPMAAKAVGLSYPQLCLEILRSAKLHVGQYKRAKQTEQTEASS